VSVLASEKIYKDFKLSTENQGGHSSRPTAQNAIYQLSHALAKIESYSFPIMLNDVSRGYFAKFGAIEGGQKGADMITVSKMTDADVPATAEALARLRRDPSNNAILHTNCVATQITGGHAPNALPQHATANVNCRIFPGIDQERVREQLIRVIGDPGVKVEFQSPPETQGAPPVLSREVMGPIEALSRDMFPGVAVIPSMTAGATDGRFLTPAGIPTYGVSGMMSDGATTNAHGLDERIRVRSLMEGREFLYRLTKMYGGGR
jgi:acetylornithine deacetylase/succinyl-diaminopimelate desuccinylase-like protein